MTKPYSDRLLNDQEEAIARLRIDLADMERRKDLAVMHSLDMHQALRRIECAEDIEVAHKIAQEAISKAAK